MLTIKEKLVMNQLQLHNEEWKRRRKRWRKLGNEKTMGNWEKL